MAVLISILPTVPTSTEQENDLLAVFKRALLVRSATIYIAHFTCTTEAELPTTNVLDNDTAFCADTGRSFLRTDGAWVASTVPTGVWGGIAGTLSDQTDLQAALDAKQATLASGTNIKTINGSSVLGSGDLPVSADPLAAWPVGSVFLSVVSTSPATLLGGGTWTQIAGGKVLIGQTSGDADFDTAEETGGSKTSAALLAHTHTITDGGHNHTQDAHTHTQNSHNHTQDSHNHTQDSHNHTQDSHNHTQDSHNHTQDSHNHTQDSHNHTQDSHNHTQNSHTHNLLPTTATTGSSTATQGTFATDTSATVGTGVASANIASATATNQAATATNQATTATNQAATATNQAATATNQNATATNQSATTGITGTNSAGSGASFSLMNPYLVVYIWKRTA